MIAAEIIKFNELQKCIEALNQKLGERDQKIIILDQLIIQLNEQLDWFKRQIFGKRSERIVSGLNSHQLQFEGFENFTTQETEAQTVPAHQRHKPKRNGQDAIKLPPDLPVKTTVIDIPEEEKIVSDK